MLRTLAPALLPLTLLLPVLPAQADPATSGVAAPAAASGSPAAMAASAPAASALPLAASGDGGAATSPAPAASSGTAAGTATEAPAGGADTTPADTADDGTPTTLPSVAALAPATTPGMVMAMDRLLPGATDGKIKPLLADEARSILGLYLAGTIRDWYFRQDRPGAIFILNTNADTARQLLAQLPLVKAGLVGFDIIPVGPYIPLATLLQREPPAKKTKHRK